MLRADAAAVMREVLKTANVYVLAHVIDDIGEATVRGALEAGGLVGPSAGQIPPHRVLFCSTLEGKTSIVRQLEPELHIDGHPQTVIPKMLALRKLCWKSIPCIFLILLTCLHFPTSACIFNTDSAR